MLLNNHAIPKTTFFKHPLQPNICGYNSEKYSSLTPPFVLDL